MKIKTTQPILCLKPTQFSVGVLEIEHMSPTATACELPPMMEEPLRLVDQAHDLFVVHERAHLHGLRRLDNGRDGNGRKKGQSEKWCASLHDPD